MLEMGTSGLMSGEGKPPAACRSRPSALPRLYGPLKTPENAHNTGFLRMARGSGDGRGVAVWWRKRGSGGSDSPFVSSAQPVG